MLHIFIHPLHPDVLLDPLLGLHGQLHCPSHLRKKLSATDLNVIRIRIQGLLVSLTLRLSKKEALRWREADLDMSLLLGGSLGHGSLERPPELFRTRKRSFSYSWVGLLMSASTIGPDHHNEAAYLSNLSEDFGVAEYLQSCALIVGGRSRRRCS
jgi:hypothetical protein